MFDILFMCTYFVCLQVESCINNEKKKFLTQNGYLCNLLRGTHVLILIRDHFT
jgi:hypothetical protein